MSLLETTKLLLRTHRISPNKLLGQNFTIEPSIFRRLIDYASLGSDDVVLDVGAGFGFLAKLLANNCKSVVAVEADRVVAEVLRDQLRGSSNVETIQGNVLKVQVPRFNKVVSIPPYQISSKLLAWLLPKGLDCAVLVVQKEFANKLVASVGSDDYGWLTVVTHYYVETELLDAIPKSTFYPEPNVDSVIICLKPKKPKPFRLKDEKSFQRFVRSLFINRNRKVKNAVLPFLKGMRAMKQEDVDKLISTIPFRNKRLRELSPEDFGALANALA
jgi:16S rRNA (adenine1518-N6/adenine1519-N6)-dimethyltransferase